MRGNPSKLATTLIVLSLAAGSAQVASPQPSLPSTFKA
jgi:hypothetical protein